MGMYTSTAAAALLALFINVGFAAGQNTTNATGILANVTLGAVRRYLQAMNATNSSSVRDAVDVNGTETNGTRRLLLDGDDDEIATVLHHFLELQHQQQEVEEEPEFPGSTCPGQRTIMGTRIPPS